MAKKPTISTVSSGYSSTTTLNNNFEALRDAFDNTLSRDGSTPNAMGADLDMNSNDILNVGEIDVQAISIGGVDIYPGNTQIATTYATQNYTGNGSTTTYAMGYNPGSKANVDVYIDGVYQNQDAFNITGTNLTFTAAPPLNSAIEIKVPVNVTSLTNTDSSQIVYNQGGTGAVTTNVKAKLQEFVSVKDFGAVADGATDDGPAFNLALQAAHTLGKIVYVPAGNYRIDTTLVFDVGNKMHGEGRGDAIGDTEIKGSRLFGSANPMVKFVNVTSPGTATFGQEIIGCYLRGTNTGSQVGIQLGETSTSTNARNFTLRDFSIRNFNTNIEFQAASYQFEISNFVSRVSTNSTKLTVAAVNPATTYTVADASGFDVGDVVGIQLNTGAVHEATLTGVNTGSNLITVDTAVPSNAAIDNAVFLANKNIHVNTTAGPTSGSIHSASIYNCFGVYWNGGGAPGISVHSIDFDTCDIAIYVSGDVKGPSLFRNISSEFTITSDIVCVATGAFVGVDGYYAHAGTCDQNRIRNTSTSTLLVNNAYVNTALIAAGKDAYSNESTGSLYVDGDSFPLNTQRLNGDVYAGVYGILESTTNTNQADNSSYIDLHSYKSVSFSVGSGTNEDTFTLDMSDHRLGVFKVMIYDNNATTQIGEFNISKFNDTGNYDTVNDQSGRFTMTRVDANTYDLRTTNASATAAVVTVPSLCKVSRKA